MKLIRWEQINWQRWRKTDSCPTSFLGSRHTRSEQWWYLLTTKKSNWAKNRSFRNKSAKKKSNIRKCKRSHTHFNFFLCKMSIKWVPEIKPLTRKKVMTCTGNSFYRPLSSRAQNPLTFKGWAHLKNIFFKFCQMIWTPLSYSICSGTFFYCPYVPAPKGSLSATAIIPAPFDKDQLILMKMSS